MIIDTEAYKGMKFICDNCGYEVSSDATDDFDVDDFQYCPYCGMVTDLALEKDNEYGIAKIILEEYREYLSIGTVKDIHNKLSELQKWRTNVINQKIKNVFANTSTLICCNCDHKDEYIEELEENIKEYREIGTVEECRWAIERINTKKVLKQENPMGVGYLNVCPTCKRILVRTEIFGRTIDEHCVMCGQALEFLED